MVDAGSSISTSRNTRLAWIVQQLREAFPESCSYRYAILDGDAKFGEDVTELLRASGIKPTRISPASPWQNGVAERWIGSCRRELLDHLVVLNDVHLRRLIRGYISYYHADRIHDSLEKDTPAMRPVSYKRDPSARLVSFQRIGGLLDPRVGRGPYVTFPTWLPEPLRVPIDHVLFTPEFRLLALKRLQDIGSDHLPLFAALCHVPDQAAPAADMLQLSPGDLRRAREAIEDGRDDAARSAD